MPSRKGLDQSLTWLRSKIAEGDTLDAINAEVCMNVILDLEKRRKAIGAMYHQTKQTSQELRNRLEGLIYQEFEEELERRDCLEQLDKMAEQYYSHEKHAF